MESLLIYNIMKRKIHIDWGFTSLVFIVIAVGALIGAVVYKSTSNIPDNVTETEVFEQVFRTEFDGHTYIVFKTSGGMDKYDMSGVVHDPDCKCFNK